MLPLPRSHNEPIQRVLLRRRLIYYYNLGDSLEEVGRLSEAVQCFRKAVEVATSLSAAANNLGAVRKARGDQDAPSLADKAAPSLPETHNRLGKVLKKLGRSDDAVRCFRKAIELAPAFAEAHANLANVLKELVKSAEALI